MTGSAGDRTAVPGAGMLGEWVRELRHRAFVGRDREVQLFRAALAGPGVIFVHGPGGVGKSSLLELLAEVAAREGRDAVRVDCRHLPPLPGALPTPAGDERLVLLIDTYELFEQIDDWVRDEYLPSLPAGVLVVVAGRRPPGPRWRADPAWRELVQVIALPNLTHGDGLAYLAAQGTPAELHDRLLAISHGHPLTLSMLVDAVRRGAEPHALDDLPDVVGALLAHTLDEAPGPRHRTALEVCAHAHDTTEDLLRWVLGDDVGKLFSWLRTLPFIDDGPLGLYPHDLARDALLADLRWRDRDRYADLRRRVRAQLLVRFHAAADQRERIQMLADTIVVLPRSWLTKHVPPLPVTEEYVDELRTGDRAEIFAMTEVWQGQEQAALAAYWMERRPDAFRVFRADSGETRGYAACLDLGEDDVGVDPGADAMWRYARKQGPPRRGEHVRAWRFFLDRDRGQRSSPSVTLFSACQLYDILTRDDTAWTLIGAYDDAELWGPTMGVVDFWRAADADYAIGGTRYPVFAHDWRGTDTGEWLELVGGREVTRPAGPNEERAGGSVLSEAQFADAVRSALHDFDAPRRLQKNPLLQSRVVRQHTRDGQPPAVALCELLERAAGTLPSGLGEVVERTFLRPVTTQERVAEQLHLSFSTYRRHRDRAVAQIIEWLWEREIGHRMTTG